MQIVRDLAGYSYGRSDLVRRAMAKKKASVMAKEKNNFIFGNEEEGVPGCVKRGIPENIATKIFDDMTSFAEYAFNKSHAAAYAVVSYQTAYLKCYYPVEFMAALLTSFLENTAKITSYILTCRHMGIQILPPDINEGEYRFTPQDGNIRYGLAAIKGVGKPVIDEIVEERKAGGKFHSLKDFCMRMSGKSVNKRAMEGFIKAGALDSLPGTRKQKMCVYAGIMDGISQERKNTMTGQMSLFDFAAPEEKEELDVKLPDVGEYDKETLLSFEKEMLGVYISGHPLEKYEKMWQKNISATTMDFAYQEELHGSRLFDGAEEIIGGMVEGITIKHTKNNKTMVFLTIEDLLGTVEVVVFPRQYEIYRNSITQDGKLFIRGHVSAEEEKASKLICDKIWKFEDLPKELWIQFSDRESFMAEEKALYEILRSSDGTDQVVVYIRSPKSMKRLGKAWSICADETLLQKIVERYGQNNVKVVEKCIENNGKMN